MQVLSVNMQAIWTFVTSAVVGSNVVSLEANVVAITEEASSAYCPVEWLLWMQPENV